MLLASAPSREWSLLSSRPTSRAHDKPLCQGDPTGREAVLYRSTLHERRKLATYLGHWPILEVLCSSSLLVVQALTAAQVQVWTRWVWGEIFLLSWVLSLESWWMGRASKGTCPIPGREISRWKKEEEMRWGLFGSPPAFCTRNPGYYIFRLKHE